MVDTLYVNLMGGPGIRKSNNALGVAYKLQCKGIETELVQEYAKDNVWGMTTQTLEDQIYVFGKQQHRQFRLRGKVQVVVTDSPLVTSLIYDNTGLESFRHLVLETFGTYRNYNILLTRGEYYNPNGRMQTKEEAEELDTKLKLALDRAGVGYVQSPANDNDRVVQMVINKLYPKLRR